MSRILLEDGDSRLLFTSRKDLNRFLSILWQWRNEQRTSKVIMYIMVTKVIQESKEHKHEGEKHFAVQENDIICCDNKPFNMVKQLV